jgi:hypothetical protein
VASFDDVVRLTAGLPLVEMGTSYGTPSVKVKGKSFCRMWSDREYARDGVADTEVLVLFCELEEKEMLFESTTGVCFETPHYHGHGAYLVRMADVDLDELRDLLEDSYRLKAPATALKELDGVS